MGGVKLRSKSEVSTIFEYTDRGFVSKNNTNLTNFSCVNTTNLKINPNELKLKLTLKLIVFFCYKR